MLSQDSSAPITHVIRTPNRAGACGLHVLPYQDKLYVGATNEIKINPDTQSTVGWVHFLMECALEQISQRLFSSKVCEIKVGNRPSPMDGFPLIGRTSISNLFLLSGTYRDGFHQSPYLAHLVTDNVLSGKTIYDGFFTPERTPIETMTREEAINEAVEHQMASLYEGGAKFPPASWDVSLMKYLKHDIENFYKILGANMNLLPEHTLMLRENHKDETIMNFFKNYFATEKGKHKSPDYALP